MQDLKKFGKKLFTMSVVGMTMVWSVGLSALVPAGVAAVTCPELKAGDLIKVPTDKKNPATTAVYLVTEDMKKLYFPHASVFTSWYPDWSGIKTMDGSCVTALQTKGGVNVRPGSRLLKSGLSEDIFAVGPNNTRMKVDAAVLPELYGAKWKDLVWYNWPDVFDTNLTPGPAITTAKPHDGQLVMKSGDTVVYMVSGGKLQKVDGTLPAQAKNDVRTLSSTVFGSLTLDAGTVTPATLVANPSQLAPGATPAPTPAPAPGATGGTLSAALAADTPAAPAGGLPSGTAYDKMLKITLKADDKDTKLTSLTITKTGFLADSKVTGVSVWDSKGYRHGDVMTSFSSDHKVVVGFANNPILVAKGTPETVTVAFNIDSSATSGSVGASINAKTDIGTDGTAGGTFPIAGNLMSVVDGAGSISTFTVTSTAAGGNTASTDAANVAVGDVREIGKFKFTETSGKNDIVVKSMVFYIDGTTKDADFTDFEILAPDNAVLGKTKYSGSRYVTVVLDKPYTITKSQNRTLTLRAKVSNGSGNYLRVQIQNNFDVLVEDASYGVGLLPTSYTAAYASDAFFKVKSGSLTLAKNTASKSGNVSTGASNVELATFDVTAVGEDMEIRKIGISIATSGPNITQVLQGNVRLVTSDGEQLLSFDGSTASDAIFTGGSQRNLSLYWNLKAGTTKQLKVIADLTTNVTSTSYTVSVGNFYSKRMSTLDFADNLPSSSNTGTAGNAVTVQNTNLTMNKDTSLSNRNIAPGSTGVVIGQYVAQAGSAEDVRLTSMGIKFSSAGTAGAGDVVKNMEIWAGTSTASMAKLGTTVNTVATTTNSYTFDLLIPANTAQVIQVRANLDSNMTSAGTLITQVDTFNYIGKGTNNTTTDGTDVTGQTITGNGANVLVNAASDSTTVSAILTPSAAPQQIAKWKFEAQNEDVTINRITFQPVDGVSAGAISGDANQFGTFYLYDSADLTNFIAQTSYTPGSGAYVRFTKDNMLKIMAGQTKYLVLKAVINDPESGLLATTTAWVIPTTTSDNIQLTRSTGGLLTNDQIDIGQTSNNGTDSNATTTFYLFHTAAPKIVAGTVSYSPGPQAQIFKFTVTNPGTRPIRLASTTVNIAVTGMLASGSTGTGTLSAFKLWDATGGSMTQLSTTTFAANTLSSGAAANASCIAAGAVTTVSGENGSSNCVNAATSSINLVFGKRSEVNSSFSNGNPTVDPGSSRTFVVTADTTNIFTGKGANAMTVQITPKLDGDIGYSSGDTTNEASWANGVLTYFYTPVSGSENTAAYSASDSYDVFGTTLTISG